MLPTKVLVVDDEIANLQKLQRTLINRYSVLAASSGSEGLDKVRSDGSIAVIIADQRMPDMAGTEFLRQTLELLPDAVRIILTGFTDVDVLMEAINSNGGGMPAEARFRCLNLISRPMGLQPWAHLSRV